MQEVERLLAIKRRLFDFVRSTSLRHIRDTHSLLKLAQEIVREFDQMPRDVDTEIDVIVARILVMRRQTTC